MKKIIKKNQVIITSLAILIAVAGYLNFADVDLGFKDQEASTDSSSILEDAGYDLTDETAMLDENNAGDSLGTQDTDITGGGSSDWFHRICCTGKSQPGTGALPEQGRPAMILSITQRLRMKKNRKPYIPWFP